MHSEDLITVTRHHNQIMQFESRQRMEKENKAQQRGEVNGQGCREESLMTQEFSKNAC